MPKQKAYYEWKSSTDEDETYATDVTTARGELS